MLVDVSMVTSENLGEKIMCLLFGEIVGLGLAIRVTLELGGVGIGGCLLFFYLF
jgi:hypothetical protein